MRTEGQTDHDKNNRPNGVMGKGLIEMVTVFKLQHNAIASHRFVRTPSHTPPQTHTCTYVRYDLWFAAYLL